MYVYVFLKLDYRKDYKIFTNWTIKITVESSFLSLTRIENCLPFLGLYEDGKNNRYKNRKICDNLIIH